MSIRVTKNGRTIFEEPFDVGKAMDFTNDEFKSQGRWPTLGKDYVVMIHE